MGGALLSMIGMSVGAGAIETMEIRSVIWIISVSRRVVETFVSIACRCVVS